MPITVLDEITAALREIGVAGEGYSLSASESADGLTALNRMVDQWAAERLQIFKVTRTAFNLTANVQDYAVGTGSIVNVARPVFVEQINIQDTSPNPDVEIPLGDPLTDEEWAAIQVKALTSAWPQAAYYNPTYPTGTISFWPVPTSTTLQGVLYAPQAVAQFAGLTDVISLPPGYEEMLVTNLAVRLLASYGRTPDPTLMQRAVQAKAIVMRANKRLTELSLDAGALIGCGGYSTSDFYSGT